MSDKYFIDTNIFVYAFDKSEDVKREKSNNLIKRALIKNSGCTSYQVIQEFINVATRKFIIPLSIADCQKYLDNVLSPLCEIFTSISLYHRAIDIMERWKYSFYDSLIIAAARQAECSILYSENLQHNQKIHSLSIINPFM